MKVKNGQTVKVHYKGTFDDGNEFDSSYSRGEPISVEVGKGQVIKGFDNALVSMSVGDVKKVSLQPEEAYGDVIPQAFVNVQKTGFPENYEFNEGNVVPLTAPTGQQMQGLISEVKDDSVIVNLNHPLAGKSLNFDIELIEIEK